MSQELDELYFNIHKHINDNYIQFVENDKIKEILETRNIHGRSNIVTYITNLMTIIVVSIFGYVHNAKNDFASNYINDEIVSKFDYTKETSCCECSTNKKLNECNNSVQSNCCHK
jgi:hypothetical protein